MIVHSCPRLQALGLCGAKERESVPKTLYQLNNHELKMSFQVNPYLLYICIFLYRKATDIKDSIYYMSLLPLAYYLLVPQFHPINFSKKLGFILPRRKNVYDTTELDLFVSNIKWYLKLYFPRNKAYYNSCCIYLSVVRSWKWKFSKIPRNKKNKDQENILTQVWPARDQCHPKLHIYGGSVSWHVSYSLLLHELPCEAEVA